MYVIKHNGQYKLCLSNLARVILKDCKTKELTDSVNKLEDLLTCDYHHNVKLEIYDINDIEIIFSCRTFKAVKYKIAAKLKMESKDMYKVWNERYKPVPPEPRYLEVRSPFIEKLYNLFKKLKG